MQGRVAWSRWIPDVFAALGMVVVMTLTFSIFVQQPTVQADLSTFLYPAVARERGFGALYVDLVDIKPPLIFTLLAAWSAVLGASLPSMWLLYALLLGLLLSGFWVALRQQIQPWLALVLFASCAATVVRFGLLEQFFFITEVVCLALALWALILVRARGRGLVTLFAAAVMLGAAGQVKEVFILAPAALLPIAWAHERRWRAMGVVLAGVVTALAGTVAALAWWGSGSIAAYFEVLGFKRSRFPLPTATEVGALLGRYAGDLAQWLPLLGLFLVTVVALAAARFIHTRRANVTMTSASGWRVRPEEWMLVFFFLAVMAAYLWQGEELRGYWATAVVFPLFLLLAVLLSHALADAEWLGRPMRLLVATLLIVGVLPAVSSILWVLGRTAAVRPLDMVAAGREAESPEALARFQEIGKAAPEGACLHIAYEWSATQFYLYSGLPPCTRVILPPLASQTPALAEELRASLIARPPEVILMDLTHAYEESEVFPFPAVTAQCYQPVPGNETLFVRKFDDAAASACTQAVVADFLDHQAAPKTSIP